MIGQFEFTHVAEVQTSEHQIERATKRAKVAGDIIATITGRSVNTPNAKVL